jgi:DNA polymerase-3 subunit delta
MGVLTFDALLRSVKKAAPDPAYYLYGDEDVLKDEAVRALCEVAVDPAARAFNLDQRTAGDLDPEAIHALLNTPPMLADRRVVVLRNVEGLRRRPKSREELLRYLRQPSAAAVLVLTQAAGEDPADDLVRLTTAVDVGRLPPERVARWLAHHAARHGLTLAPEAAALLLQAVGDDLGTLGREVEKLSGLTGGGEAVGPEQVAALVGVRHGETVDDLVQATLGRQAARAAQLVGRVLEQPGVSGVRVVTALGTELVATALARAERDAGTPPGRLEGAVRARLERARPRVGRPWSAAIADWCRWAEQWPAADLSRALRLTLDADRALKASTVSDDRGILRQLVLSLGLRAREAA